jgi:hypothetical protein
LRLRVLANNRDGSAEQVEADLRQAIDELLAFGAPFPRAQAELALATQLQRVNRSDEAASLRARDAVTGERVTA